MKKHDFLALIAASGLLTAPGFAADTADTASAVERNWAQWRGPKATGLAPLGKPPVKWSETENIKWKSKIPGYGTSTPVIWEDQVFILTAVPTGKKVEPKPESNDKASEPAAPPPPPRPDGPDPGPGRPGRPGRGDRGMRSETPNEAQQFVLICMDRKTGAIVWQEAATEQVPHEGHHRDHGFASASPVTDGKLVFASFGSRGIYCYDLEGNKKWSADFGDMQTRNSFGEGSSPALHGDTLVLNWDHEGEDFLVALDKNTGKEKWRVARDEPTTWTTPLILEHDGVVQVIVSGTNRIRSHELATGKQLWECGGMTTNVIPTPMSDFGLLYATSGFRGAALLAIRLGRTGDLTDTDAIAWRHGKGTPYVPSPLLYGQRLYFYSGNTAILSCFDAKTGKPYYEQQRISELSGGVYASITGANGHVYLVGRDGTTVVLRDSDTLEIVATNKLDEKFDASPAIAGREIFLRGHGALYCIGAAE